MILDYYDKFDFFRINNEAFYPIWAGLEIVEKCNESDTAVIGIETFVYEQERVTPQMDLIADYSGEKVGTWADYQVLCNKSAQKFLANLDSIERGALLVSLTLLPKVEWDY